MKMWKKMAAQALARVLRLEQVVANLENRMSKMKDDIDAKFKLVDEETNTLATEITDLKSQIAGGLTPEEAKDVSAKLGNISDRLKTIGSDPENPVPDPTPAADPEPIADTTTGDTGTDTTAGTGGGV